jgi:hypothetical protein
MKNETKSVDSGGLELNLKLYGMFIRFVQLSFLGGGGNCVVVGFTTTCAMSAYHH